MDHPAEDLVQTSDYQMCSVCCCSSVCQSQSLQEALVSATSDVAEKIYNTRAVCIELG